MRRFEIRVRRGAGRDHQAVLGRFGSLVATVVLAALAIMLLALALVFGYLVLGLLLGAVLIALAVAVVRGLWAGLRSREQ
jgi:hypothetical protein